MTTTLAPPAPPPLSEGGRGPLRVVLVIAAIAVISIVVALLAAAALGLSALRLVTDHQSLPTTMRSLTVDTADSPMAVRIISDPDATEPRADVRMIASDRRDKEHLTVTTDANGTHLRVDPQTGFLPWGDPGEITVTVPPELGRQLFVTVRQDTGVLIAQADLDQLTVTNADGAVILRGTVRRVEVRGQDGDIHTREPIAVTESFTASTADGDIDVRFAEDPPPHIDATTRDGDITISLPPPGPYLVHAQSGNGDATVRVPETTDPARAATEITARSDDGDVVIDSARSGRMPSR